MQSDKSSATGGQHNDAMASGESLDHAVPVRPRQYVVGIGASAGGLDALEKVFATMPPDTDAAFVVIQHLSPDHKSMMASLLARHTVMPVLMVEDGMPIEANHVYLIPPGSIMHLENEILRLTPKSPRALTLPVDVFFQSLATSYGDHAVGVILSGTGSDGTRGAGAINEAGGFLLAQEPEDAKFDGMPRSVISTGLVDAVLPVDKISARIVTHLTNQPGQIPAEVVNHLQRSPVAPESAFSGILHLLSQVGGINFEEYKPGTVTRRIERRMAVRQINSLESYLALLNYDRTELHTLRREMLIPVTSFFRDADAFEALQQQVIEPLVASRETGQALRVWCAGVSTGEEAYSIAMLFLEAFERLKRWPLLKLFATDVEQSNIEAASSGSYPESIMTEVSAQQLERFFTKRGNQCVVKSEVRQCIVFARHNLLVDPPFTKMDLVVCRNTLIYFRSAAQHRVMRRLQYALAPMGCLFLGSSESLGDLQADFQTLSARHKIWKLVRPTSLPLNLSQSLPASPPGMVLARRPTASGKPRQMPETAVQQGFSVLLNAFGPPPAILVNASHELVHSYGDVGRFLEWKEGQATLDINRMLPDPLVPVVAALLFKTMREGSNVKSDIVRLATGASDAHGHPLYRHVCVSSWPVGEVDGQRLSLLVFEEVNLAERPDATVMINVDSESAERLEVLEHELAATRESLQATIEELETSNEELQATNEELMASNEELQSSNEELQSVNEELNTVNAEYQEKIDILNRVNADLDNLARVVSAGTVFVDEHLHLTRFSPDAASIFRLRDVDIGRPLGDLTHALDFPNFMEELERSLAETLMIERAVQGLDGRHFLVKMLPYQIPSSSARGVVISFIDMTAVHQASRLQDILDGLAEHVAVLDEQGRIVLVNAAWSNFARNNGDPDMRRSGPGVSYLSVCAPPPDASDAKFAMSAADGLRSVLDGRQDHFSLEYPCHSPTEERWFVMHARRLHGESPGAVVSHIDITPWRHQEALPAESLR